jgi:hypothetical protein
VPAPAEGNLQRHGRRPHRPPQILAHVFSALERQPRIPVLVGKPKQLRNVWPGRPNHHRLIRGSCGGGNHILLAARLQHIRIEKRQQGLKDRRIERMPQVSLQWKRSGICIGRMQRFARIHLAWAASDRASRNCRRHVHAPPVSDVGMPHHTDARAEPAKPLHAAAVSLRPDEVAQLRACNLRHCVGLPIEPNRDRTRVEARHRRSGSRVASRAAPVVGEGLECQLSRAAREAPPGRQTAAHEHQRLSE